MKSGFLWFVLCVCAIASVLYVWVRVLIPVKDNTDARMISAVTADELSAGTIVYDDRSFRVVRINIKGVDYLASSWGGLIKEQSTEDKK